MWAENPTKSFEGPPDQYMLKTSDLMQLLRPRFYSRHTPTASYQMSPISGTMPISMRGHFGLKRRPPTLSRGNRTPPSKNCPLANGKNCVYQEAGCRFRGTSTQMEEHMNKSKQVHLDLMCSLAHKQQETIKKLNDQLEKCNTSYNGVLVWKIKDLSSRLSEAKTQDGLELVSAPFYTSQYGYRVQASLFLNGNGGGENSHMSVYIKLLPGEYDSILRWPFKYTVSFTLLDQADQRKDACNIVESFIPDPNWKNFQRPSTEPDSLGFGFPKFVPHAMLEQRNYVRDDCMFLKIRVDPSRNVAV